MPNSSQYRPGQHIQLPRKIAKGTDGKQILRWSLGSLPERSNEFVAILSTFCNLFVQSPRQS